MFKKLAKSQCSSLAQKLRFTLMAVFSLAIGLAAISFVSTSESATPGSGTISEANPTVTWTGPVKAPTGSADCGTANSAACDNFKLTIVPPSAAFGPYLVEIKLQPEAVGDWDMQVYGPADDNNPVDGSGNSPGQGELVVLINPAGGTYTVAAAPFAPVVGASGNSYSARAEIKPHIINPANQGSDTNIRYHNFAATGALGNEAGEPSIGVNWNTGKVMFIAMENTLRVTFDDSTVPARATWEDKSFIWTNVITMDPILFTDRKTGRTIVSQLVTPAAATGALVLTDGCSLSAYTDNDGDTWVIDQGCGLPSGADHQSIGGGPFHAPLPGELPLPAPAAGYSHATYYCAQSGVTAYCSRSDDGGVTYGPGVPIYTTECGGLHGHPMVGNDGTVYVPNKNCGGNQGVVVSEDNGITWAVRPVPNTLGSANDPGVGIGAEGTVYLGYQNGDGRPSVAVSTDKGLNWSEPVDVGTPYGIKNTAFPRMVAGDDDRAAFAFLGTPTEGPFQDANFAGEWHLYIAHTFNRGQTWTTIDATPTDPVQRGCIWMQGGSNPCRNLLDFMGSSVDKEGRVLVGYADGCINCSSPSTSRAKKATIARQTNGRRLFAVYDPQPLIETSTTLSSSPNPSTAGQNVTFTAAVTAASGTPAGAVTFKEGETTLGTGSLDGSGQATFTTSALPVGSHSITATYSGNETYDFSTSAALAQTVNPDGGPTPTPVPTPAPCGSATQFPNVAPIAIGDASGGSPYPSFINVSGLRGAVSKVTVQLNNLNHTWPDDIDIMLVGPGGQTAIIMSDVGGQIAVSGLNLTLDSSATLPLLEEGPLVSGTFQPTNSGTSDPFPAPAPSSTGSSSLAVFNGTDPNGTWRLFVADDTAQDTGEITGGWSVSITMNCTEPGPSPTPTPVSGPPPRFANYAAPAGLGERAGEPTIGVNWKSEQTFSNSMFSIPNGGTAMYYGGFLNYALKVTFDDCPSPARAIWEKKPVVLPGAPRAFGDPILFTDKDTGRTFVSQLIGLTPLGSTTEFTDNDGDTFTPSEGSGLPSNVDHQTFGGGPYHSPAPPGAGALGYQNAVYYCSQSVVDAACSLSLDGGLTFGPAIPAFTLADCDGLHGHIKVGADGTAYIPNKGCGGPAPLVLGNEQASVVVSEDNGLTWKIRPIPHPTVPGHENDNLTKGDDDPSVGVATDGTIYLGYQSLDGHPRIAVSRDKGVTWSTPYDVGANVVNGSPVLNTTFPAVVAGDGNRAAFAFYGSETGGDNYNCGEGDDCSDALGSNPNIFTGVWYLYIATTFDGGQTWTTQNVTPGDPVQRGGICGDGTCRNLLDFFDATIDKQGRVLIGWDDGCVGGCVTGGANSFTAKATITRQTGGKRMFAALDPVEPALPGAPKGAGVINRAGTAVNLSWAAPDNGGAGISGYNVYRRNGASGTFNLIGTVNNPSFVDTTFPAPATDNLYRLTAVNSLGEGPYCSDFAAVPDSNETQCETPGLTELTDAAGDTSAALGLVNTPGPPGSDLLSFQLAQPYSVDGITRLIFTINTDAGASPQPPGSAWYVAMRIVAGGVTSYKGVHMAWNGTVPIFESYTPAPNSGGGIDGRFVTVGSQKPAEPQSSYAAPFNKVIIVVKASDLGLNPGDVIDGFVSGVSQTTDPGATVGRGATALYDEMVDGLGFTGTYTMTDNVTCDAAPTAALVANPTSGNVPLTVNFDGSGSSDSDSGDSLAYTFNFGDGSAPITQSSPVISHQYNSTGTFTASLKVRDSGGLESNTATVSITVNAPPPPTCIEDNDSRVVYSGGWHLINSTGASDGHFRYHTGNSPNHSASLDFNIPSGSTGSITYAFAKSPKGGTADVYLDGVKQATINYAGSSGSTQAPEFNPAYKVQYTGLAAGSHKLEIKNMSGVVYVDQFCLTSSTITSNPTSGPGNTTNQSGSASAGQTTSSNYQPQSGSQQMTVTVESTLNVPFKITLVSPSGLTLQTVDAVGSIATLNQPVTQGGTYVVKVVNVSLGPLQFTTTVTPQVAR